MDRCSLLVVEQKNDINRCGSEGAGQSISTKIFMPRLKTLKISLAMLFIAFLSACGGGGGTSAVPENSFTVTVTGY
jgi:hypothetical protein